MEDVLGDLSGRIRFIILFHTLEYVSFEVFIAEAFLSSFIWLYLVRKGEGALYLPQLLTKIAKKVSLLYHFETFWHVLLFTLDEVSTKSFWIWPFYFLLFYTTTTPTPLIFRYFCSKSSFAVSNIKYT